MLIEHEDCTYSDHEFDHTAEEVASPSSPPGCGSIIYTDEEWEAIEDYHYAPTKEDLDLFTGGAGPTGCLSPGCDKNDGRTRASGVHCNDCREELGW
jgi:hypothetical protein